MNRRSVRGILAALMLLAAASLAAAQTGSISGTVTDAITGLPIAGVMVRPHRGQFHTVSPSDALGRFSIGNINPDTYFLTATAPGVTYPVAIHGNGCYPYRCAPEDGSPVVVNPGTATTGIAIQLYPRATVQGELRDVTIALVTECARVRLYDADGFEHSNTLACGGSYTLPNVPPGNYYVFVAPVSSTPFFSPELSDGRHCGTTCTVTGGTPFPVTAGATVTRNFILDAGGIIRGRVTETGTGAGIEFSLSYEAVSLTDGTVFAGSHLASGNYEIRVPPGRFAVRARSLDDHITELYPNVPAACVTTSPACLALLILATPIEVLPAETVSGINLTLDVGSRLGGALTIDTVQGAPAMLTLSNGAGTPMMTTGSAFAPGSYLFRGIPAGRYFLCAQGPELATTAYGGPEFPSTTCPPESGTPIDVVAGADVSGINVALRRVGTTGAATGFITGFVRHEGSGAAVAGQVQLFRNGAIVRTVSIDVSTGAYSIASLPAGRYHLRTAATQSVIDMWWGSHCVVCGPGFGTHIDVQPSSAVTDINFSLLPGGKIEGLVLPSITRVDAFDGMGRFVKSGIIAAAQFTATYSIGGLLPGEYFVVARGTEYDGLDIIDTIYPNLACSAPAECPVLNGMRITVPNGGTVGGINLASLVTGRVQGRVTTSPVRILNSLGDFPAFTVQAYDRNGRPVGRFIARAHGRYEIRGLLSGVHYFRTVDAQSRGYADQLYDTVACAGCPVTSGTPVLVSADETASGIDFSLVPAGAIAGRVFDGASAPLDNITVRALAHSGRLVGTAITTRDGTYAILGLPAGSYLVETSNDGPFVDRFYTSPGCPACTGLIGDRVNVIGTRTTGGIDMRLQRGVRISGKVKGDAGHSATGAVVTIQDFWGNTLGTAIPDTDGAYVATIAAPAASTYARVEGATGLAAQMYSEVACPLGICNTSAASPLPLPVAGLLGGIDFTLASCQPPTVVPYTLEAATVGSQYLAGFHVFGHLPDRYRVIDGALPTGLSLDSSNGLLSGSLLAPGDFRFTIGATDPFGCSGARTYSVSVGECSVTLDTASLSFNAGGGTATVNVTSTCHWPASSTQPWAQLQSAPSAVTITVPFNPGAPRYATVAIGDKSVAIAQGAVQATPPFGFLDLPADHATVSGSIAVGGWALDDLEVRRISVWRDPAPGEPGTLIYVGDAVRVRGARPDVEAAYSTYPFRDRAGWGFLLLTNMLPNGGNGTFRLHVIVEDVEGYRTLLGTRTIIAANAASSLPFGTIDTPAQGGTIRGGSYPIFGWALTPQPNHIPADGSTITVFIDGVALPGPVSYGHFREDINFLFPGYRNTDGSTTAGAVGHKIVDTTQLADGLHTIAWSVNDSAGNGAGMGSRYFVVDNASAGVTEADPRSSAASESAAALEPALIEPDGSRGEPRPIVIEEMSRLELDVPALIRSTCAAPIEGYELVGGERRRLPVGSALDAAGRFTWQPGPGFMGTYRLEFRAKACSGGAETLSLTVTIVPASR